MLSVGFKMQFHEYVKMMELRKKYELFCDTVTIRGLSRIARTRNKIISCFWLISVLVCSVSLLWQLSVILTNYLSYPYTTMVGEGNEKSTFPYISFCNLKIKSSNDQLSIEQHVRNVEFCMKTIDYENVKEMYGISEMEMILALKKHLLPSGYYSNFPIGFLTDDASVNNSMVLSHNFVDWNFRPLNISPEIFPFWQSMYRRCFTLKVPKTHANSIRAASLTMYLHNFPEYISDTDYDTGIFFSKATGMRVLFHYPGSFPDMISGLSIGPGTETTFTIQSLSRTRLPYPYNDINCTNREYSGMFFYSQSLCIEVCMQESVIKKCRCLSLNFHFTQDQMESVGGILCGNMSGEDLSVACKHGEKRVPKFASQLACEESVMYEENFCAKECLPSCKETSYHYSGKSAPWPDASQQLSFYKSQVANSTIPGVEEFNEYRTLLEEKLSQNKTDAEILQSLKKLHKLQDNFVQIYIKLENEFPQLYTDVAMINPSSVISYIGGTLSLWLGITAMTLVELIEFIYILVSSCFLQKAKEIKVDNSSG